MPNLINLPPFTEDGDVCVILDILSAQFIRDITVTSRNQPQRY
jgi:hypothetical protein